MLLRIRVDHEVKFNYKFRICIIWQILGLNIEINIMVIPSKSASGYIEVALSI